MDKSPDQDEAPKAEDSGGLWTMITILSVLCAACVAGWWWLWSMGFFPGALAIVGMILLVMVVTTFIFVGRLLWLYAGRK